MSVFGNKDTQGQPNLNNATINNRMTSDEGSEEEDFPNEEECITIDKSKGITSEECAVAIGKLIGPSNIRFASEKSTEGKMCFYLNSQETVSKLLHDHRHVKIGNQILQLRSLKEKMITIFNISPIVPHSIIEHNLSEMNVSINTPIYFMKAGIREPGYEHIRSFDRCSWINVEDIDKVPRVIRMKFKDNVLSKFSKEKQGIVIDKPSGISLEQCTVAIGKLIGPSKIRFASVRADGMYFYLDSRLTVHKLLDDYKYVMIGNKILKLRSLICKEKMIIISNISPIVPHSIIEDKLSKMNVSRNTPIYFMTARIDEPGYEHIKSSQRCVWINAEDVDKLPNAMQINYKDNVYRIHCWVNYSWDLYLRNIITEEQLVTAVRERELQCKELPTPLSNATVSDKIIHQENQGLNDENKNLDPSNVCGKRVLSSSASSSSNNDPITKDNQLLSSQNSDIQTPNKEKMEKTLISTSATDRKDTQCQSNLNNAAINNTMTSHEGSDEDAEGITSEQCFSKCDTRPPWGTGRVWGRYALHRDVDVCVWQ